MAIVEKLELFSSQKGQTSPDGRHCFVRRFRSTYLDADGKKQTTEYEVCEYPEGEVGPDVVVED